MATANEQLRDAAIRHRIYLLRYDDFLYRKLLLDFLNDMDADLVKGIASRMATGKINWGNSFTTRRMVELHEFTQALIDDMAARLRDDLESGFADLAEQEVEWQAGTINNAVPVTLDLVTPAPDLLRGIVKTEPLSGLYLKDWAAQWGAAKQNRVTQAIRIGLGEGQTAEQIVARIAGTRARQYQDGIIEISRQGARGLVRTASNSVTTAARDALYEANKDVLKGVVWCSTLDSRTTLICASRDGKVYPVGSGPRPPSHFNCRSVVSPLTKSFREMGIDLNDLPVGTRPAVVDGLAGNVPGTETYQTWLKRQSPAFQDDVLGPARGALFRDGGLTLDSFVDQATGERFTLDELRRREPEAFRRSKA